MFKEYTDALVGNTAIVPVLGNAYKTVITADDFATAFAEITAWKGYVPTPLYHLEGLAKTLELGCILYKDEGPRFGLGSFKALGGAYAGLRILQRELSARLDKPVSMADIRTGAYADDVAKITLASATDGNHGRSLAWGAQRFGASCQIYIHRDVSEGRAQAMRDLGATVTRVDGDYDASVADVRRDADANGWFVVSDTSWDGYTQPPTDVMAGYGVMVHEVVQELDTPPTHVFLQGGVGGLAAAVAAGLRQHWGNKAPRVVVVEPELAACLFASAKAGEVTNVAIKEETLMAGLSCGEPSPLAWAILREEAQDFLTIPESIVAPAMRIAGRPVGGDPTIIAGESAVAGFAAVIAAASQDGLRDALGLDADARVLVIGSEGATDPEIYAQLMAG
ncbi:MAG: diaminopropionate ammonia-lyase [Proteobacteria bacterium]|nr:diaminopropionate ammonia-lyase [Pseudomonadota bacterium]